MAKIKYGPMVGQASGSIGATTFSHNRYGTYTRRRAIPTQPGSPAQLQTRALLSAASSHWQSLTAGNRLSWQAWADQNPISDVLGDKQTLTGLAAYIKLDSKYYRWHSSHLTHPPVIAAPSALNAFSLTGDIGAGKVSAVFTPTPIGVNKNIEYWACVADSPAVKYVKNNLKYIGIGEDNAATGEDIQLGIESRFGTLVVGQTLHVFAAIWESTSGQWSTFQRASVVIAST